MPPMSLKLWFLRVSVEPVDIPVASDVSFCLFLCFFFFLVETFNKKNNKNEVKPVLVLDILQEQHTATGVRYCFL